MAKNTMNKVYEARDFGRGLVDFGRYSLNFLATGENESVTDKSKIHSNRAYNAGFLGGMAVSVGLVGIAFGGLVTHVGQQ